MEKIILKMKEDVKRAHKEIDLKAAIIDEIISEFEKYNSDEVSLIYSFDDHAEPTYPVCFKKRNNKIVVECEADISLDISVTNIYLSHDDLDALLSLLQHPLTKKANKK
jgi:hypothetical protein